VDGSEQEAPYQTPKPVVARSVSREIIGRHAPFAAQPDQVTQRIDHLAKLGLAWAPRAPYPAITVRQVPTRTVHDGVEAELTRRRRRDRPAAARTRRAIC